MPFSSAQVAARVCNLKPSYFLGLATKIKGNVHLIDERTILYPIGRVLVFHDLQTDNQRFMKIPDTPKVITQIVLSPNRKFIAVVEKVNPTAKLFMGKPTISVFNLETHHRVIILGNPLSNNPSDVFIDVSFTCDGEYIVAVISGISSMMIYYKINGHVESYTSAIGDCEVPHVSVTKIACNPSDRTILCIVGVGLFRFISWADGQWLQYGFKDAEKLHITGVCWLTDEMVLFGTRCGRLIAVEYADVRGVYHANAMTQIHIVKVGGGEQKVDVPSGKVPKGYKGDAFQVTCLTSFPGGFAYSCSKAEVVVFERTDVLTWVKRDVVTIPPSRWLSHKPAVDGMWFVSVSPSGRKMASTTSRREVLIADIIDRDVKEKISAAVDMKLCSKVFSGFHAGRVAGIATCRWKPLVMTIGKDEGCCRVWNYKTKKLVFNQWFPDDKIYGCAFHPTGWYCLLGFKHQLRMFMVMVDELKSLRLFRIKMCNLMQFSVQGHLFAAGNSARRTIEVYCCVSFDNIWIFKCYNNAVTALNFGNNDCILYTTDPDGSVNFWDLQTGEDLNNKIYLDTANYNIVSTKNGVVYFVGADGSLKEIAKEMLRSYKLDQKTLNAIAIGEAEECMFVGGDKKSIVSLEFPISEPVFLREAKMHSWPIKQLLITNNDSTLISLDDAGIVGFWRVVFPRDKRPPKFDNVPELCEVVINTRKLAEEDETIEKQQINIDRKLYQHNYILQHLQDVMEKEMDKLTTNFIEEIESLKRLIKSNEKMHSTLTSALQQNFEKMQKYYVGELEKQSKEFESEMMQEYLKGDSIKGYIVVFLWDAKRFIQAARAATYQIFELYDSFVNSKVAEIKGETVELRFKRKCLLQKFSRETYNFEKFINSCMDEYKLYHERRLTKLGLRKEYLMDEILFLIKKSASLEEKINTFYDSGMRTFRHLDEMRLDSRMLKTKIRALHNTLEAVELQSKKKEDMAISLRKALKSDVHEQMEKTERLETLKFSMKPILEMELKTVREQHGKLVHDLHHQRARMTVVTLCIAAVERMNQELQRKKDQLGARDESRRKFMEEVKIDLTYANKISDNRNELKKALLELYQKYIYPFATPQSIDRNCDEGGLPMMISKTEDTGLEDVVEFYQVEGMLNQAEEYLRAEIRAMKSSLPSRPRLLVGHKQKQLLPTSRASAILKQINAYRYRLGEALELLASREGGRGCPCENKS